MAKTRALLFASILLCSALLTFAARPEPRLLHGLHAKKLDKVLEGEKNAEEGVASESCDGAGEEECLMRRTLNAHIDYIYTQNGKP
ncbi:hypothetical protein SAY87_026895 [Trapa incisa]|uniref:Phytosulfokine n=2 Tax=Trapa TaxID=22665 RepID=A0AAN7MS14_TRANT|nr:hypothetical protein SAY87_026895 [Trapa incisa]KAK4800046.1 hypothetical protein SAY86_025411 [Trapa natans]